MKIRWNQKGVTIIEGVIAALIIGILGTAIMTYFRSSSRASRAADMMQMRDQLYLSVVQSVAPPALWQSKARATTPNSLLANCIDPTRPFPCTTTSAVDQVGFDLVVPDEDTVFKKIAGPSGLPAKYTASGELWETSMSEKPVFEVVSTFWGTCAPRPNGVIPATCPAAETIWVRIQVRIAGTVTENQKGGMNIRNKPADNDWDANPHMFAIPVASKDIMLLAGNLCSQDAAFEGSRVTGYDQYGQAICQCITKCTCLPEHADGTVITNYDPVRNFPPDATLGDCSRRGLGASKQKNCRCDKKECGKTEYMNGFMKGGEPRCEPIQGATGLCKTINIQTNGDCGEGNQMVNILYGECKTDYDEKNGGWEITCENDMATCCPMIK